MTANYKIRGSDGQEYGPVDAGQIKQWITEHRVERRTPVFCDGAGDWTPLESVPEFTGVFAPAAPPVLASTPSQPDPGGGLNVIIPYKNVRALTAYYLGVFSAIPILGMPLGLAAFFLGIYGLRFRRKNPAAGGVVHAWIGILAGGFFGLLWLVLIIMGICAIIGRPPHAQPLNHH
jgi:hypothetical protein